MQTVVELCKELAADCRDPMEAIRLLRERAEELEAKLDRYTRISEVGTSLGDELDRIAGLEAALEAEKLERRMIQHERDAILEQLIHAKNQIEVLKEALN